MNAAFITMIEAHREGLLRTARKLCHGDAEDMVQETFLKALRNVDRFVPETNLRAWLMRILVNTIYSHFRHRRVAREIPHPRGFDPAGRSLPDHEVSDEIRAAIDRLPHAHRRVFLMAALAEAPYREIAETLNIPLGTVMSRLWKARRALRADLN